MCHMSRVTCHVLHVTHKVSNYLIFFTKSWSLLVEGLLSTGPTPSSYYLGVNVLLRAALGPQLEGLHVVHVAVHSVAGLGEWLGL